MEKEMKKTNTSSIPKSRLRWLNDR
jgi:hypothetical protein